MLATNSASVLIAERHHGLFERIRGLLEASFDQTYVVTDRASLTEGAGRLQPTVIVLDVSYATGDLTGLMSELRQQAPSTRILLLSAHGESAVLAAAQSAGADGLVLKTAIGRHLMPAIDALLAGRRYFEMGAIQ